MVRRSERGKCENHFDYSFGPPVLAPSDAYRAPGLGAKTVVQAKLRVGAANDPYEKEADHIAEEIVRGDFFGSPSSGLTGKAGHPAAEEQGQALYSAAAEGVIQRNGRKRTFEQAAIGEALPLESPGKRLKIEEGIFNVQLDEDYDSARFDESGLVAKGKQFLFRKFESADDFVGGTDAAPIVETGISEARGGGQSLPGNLRDGMEQAFRADFSNVRIHHDARADRLNRMVDAKAFTTNGHVFFEKGQYRPETAAGRKLIAHELAHVVQQNHGLLSRFQLRRSSAESDAEVVGTRSARRTIQRVAGYLPKSNYGNYGVGAAGGLADIAGIAPAAKFTGAQRAAIYASNAGLAWPAGPGPLLAALPVANYTEERTFGNVWQQVNLQVGIGQIDHIYPRAKGGINSYKNAQILSTPDNLAKKKYPWPKQLYYAGTKILVITKTQKVPAGTILDVYAGPKAGVGGGAGNPAIKFPFGTPISAAVLGAGFPNVNTTPAGYTYIDYNTAQGFGLAWPGAPPIP